MAPGTYCNVGTRCPKKLRNKRKNTCDLFPRQRIDNDCVVLSTKTNCNKRRVLHPQTLHNSVRVQVYKKFKTKTRLYTVVIGNPGGIYDTRIKCSAWIHSQPNSDFVAIAFLRKTIREITWCDDFKKKKKTLDEFECEIERLHILSIQVFTRVFCFFNVKILFFKCVFKFIQTVSQRLSSYPILFRHLVFRKKPSYP